MLSGTEQRRVMLNILAMKSTTKDDEGEIMKDVAVMEEKQRKYQANG
jgi:hypothetical protein